MLGLGRKKHLKKEVLQELQMLLMNHIQKF